MREDKSYDFIWGQVIRELTVQRCATHRLDHILIDEAQDLNPDFFMLLPRLAASCTIFADMNQQLTLNTNATLDDIRDVLPGFHEKRLVRNYRNTKEIAAVSEQFYVGFETGKCDAPTRSGQLPMVISCPTHEAVVTNIARYARNHKDHSIGVVVHSGWKREKYCNLLRQQFEGRVQTYNSDVKSQITALDFSGNKITVLCMRSVKGLEFDAVFVDLHYGNGTLTDGQKMELYVATSRPREHLALLHSGPCPRWMKDLGSLVRFTDGQLRGPETLF